MHQFASSRKVREIGWVIDLAWFKLRDMDVVIERFDILRAMIDSKQGRTLALNRRRRAVSRAAHQRGSFRLQGRRSGSDAGLRNRRQKLPRRLRELVPRRFAVHIGPLCAHLRLRIDFPA
jgi:hypothetical protein